MATAFKCDVCESMNEGKPHQTVNTSEKTTNGFTIQSVDMCRVCTSEFPTVEAMLRYAIRHKNNDKNSPDGQKG